MPVQTTRVGELRSRKPAEQDLVHRLVCEWQGKDAPAPKPDIRQEADTSGRVVHIFVVWEDWRGLNQERRSELIMDAYEEAAGLDKAAEVTVAMGLTKEEADNLGIA